MIDNLTIPIKKIVENNLSINEYMILYSISNKGNLQGLVEMGIENISKLEGKGFIKIADGNLHLRDKAQIFFSEDNDLFVKWLDTYPTMVNKRNGGKRALSPASRDTILGKKLESKWNMVFRKDIEAQKEAIRVLELMVTDATRSGDLEYFVEATRWLNEGYHEKYSYLLDSPLNGVSRKYDNEDYM